MSEFDLINHFFKSTYVQRDDVLLGIGDDCAILSPPPGKLLAVSTDTLISGVHFPESTSADDVGYKSLAVNLSDLAAMGAQPAWANLAITLPNANTDWLERFMQGFNELAKKHNVALVGGDTTKGALSISINITGFVDHHKILKRNAAKKGDLIFVTGTIGDAYLGLKAVLNNLNLNEHLAYCVKRLNRPTPRVETGRLLGEFSLAAIDISDGLIADLNHICQSSGVGAILDIEKIPLSESFVQCTNNLPDWQSILTAGDDYELCFTCAEEQIKEVQSKMLEHNLMISCIGRITDGSGITCQLNSKEFTLNQSGYNHF